MLATPSSGRVGAHRDREGRVASRVGAVVPQDDEREASRAVRRRRSAYFVFNLPESVRAGRAADLQWHKLTHPELLIPDPTRSIVGGCFVREAFRYNPDNWDGRLIYSLSRAMGFRSRRRGRVCRSRRNAMLYGREDSSPPVPLPARKTSGPSGEARKSASKASPDASSGTIADTASAGEASSEWRRGSTA